jgi:hypothetical protein
MRKATKTTEKPSTDPEPVREEEAENSSTE